MEQKILMGVAHRDKKELALVVDKMREYNPRVIGLELPENYVKRELLKEKSDDTLIGNIPSPNKTVFYEYRLTVENYKTKNISLDLFDHVPVSQDDKIHVKNVKYSIAPTEENVKGKSGVMRWHFDLEPKAKKEITYSFTVECPRNLEISGL